MPKYSYRVMPCQNFPVVATLLSLPLGLKMEGVFENSYFATFPRAWALIILGIDACSISHAVYKVFLNKLN